MTCKTVFPNGEWWQGDCLELMKQIPDNSVDMILCDLPYGTTACKWDTVIPFEPLWEQYHRIAKKRAAIVLTGVELFSSFLRTSNIENYKYDWVWNKVNKFTNSLNVKIMPMTDHELISVFYRNQCVYNPQLREGTYITRKTTGSRSTETTRKVNNLIDVGRKVNGLQPKKILDFPSADTSKRLFHPTQKPVALFEYLIKTYTNPGDTVLDNCAGSGTTAVACENTDRRWICMEQETEYTEKALERIRDVLKVDQETKNRIRLSVAAYAFEFENDPTMYDQEFDNLAHSINPKLRTGNPSVDDLFETRFDPYSTEWVHCHPDINGLRELYFRYYLKRSHCDARYDLANNVDLFGPLLFASSKKPDPVDKPTRPCRVCGKDTLTNPLDGGCHC